MSLFLTIAYGHPETSKRHEVWALIKSLQGRLALPWLVFGDFNEILHMCEKRGGNDRSGRRMEDFRNLLSDCNVGDLGFQGPPLCGGTIGRETSTMPNALVVSWLILNGVLYFLTV